VQIIRGRRVSFSALRAKWKERERLTNPVVCKFVKGNVIRLIDDARDFISPYSTSLDE
jgi:hypothetical protein